MAQKGSNELKDLYFLSGGGEMGEITRKVNWSDTSLGAVQQWPKSLCTTLGILLHNAFPMFLFWGKDAICFYNDAYRPSLGIDGRHPAVGKKARMVWYDIWPTIGAYIDTVMTEGRAVWFEDQLLPIFRDGYIQQVYWTFSYSPVFGDDGPVAGVLVTCTETTKKVKMIHALEESEARFRTMAEGTNILVAVGDESSNATYFNQAWEKLTGRPMKDLLRFGWADLIHPEDKERYVNIYLDAFKEKVPFTGEFRILDKEGQYRWLLATGPPRFRPDGSFAGYISSCVDITERRQDELSLQKINEELAATNEELNSTIEELAQTQHQLENAFTAVAHSESKFKNIIVQAPVAIAIYTGPDYIIEVYNDNVLEYWGRTAEQVYNKPLFEVLPEAKGQGFEELLANVMKTGERVVANEVPATLLRNGVTETTWVSFVYDPLRDIDGNITGVIVVSHEVTEQVNARKELERAYGQLRLSKEAAQLGTFDLDLEKGTMEWDDRCRTLFGISHQAPVTYEKDFLTGLHPEDAERVKDIISKVFIKSVSNGDYDVEYRTIGAEDKVVRWVRAKGKAYFDNLDKPIRFIGSVIDITEQKLDELRKNDFIGMVSHELKTPLTSISAIHQVLKNKLAGSEDTFVTGALEKSGNQVKKMTTLINGFLNISRLESGKLHNTKTTFPFATLIAEVIDETNFAMPGRSILTVLDTNVSVHADRDKIAAVISNLLTNALKYSAKNEEVQIDMYRNEKAVTVCVKDNGIGISKADQEKLFDRYYRVENPLTKHTTGFGIGLYLSAEIVHSHQGEIWVESELQKGSAFYFSIPLV